MEIKLYQYYDFVVFEPTQKQFDYFFDATTFSKQKYENCLYNTFILVFAKSQVSSV